jgi:hypothetical protein
LEKGRKEEMKKLIIYHVDPPKFEISYSITSRGNNYMLLYTDESDIKLVDELEKLTSEENEELANKLGISKIQNQAYRYVFYQRVIQKSKKLVEDIVSSEIISIGSDDDYLEIIESPNKPPQYI